MKKALAVLLVLMGAACAPRPTAQQACAGYGFKPGTDAFANCLQQESFRAERLGKTFGEDMDQYAHPHKP